MQARLALLSILAALGLWACAAGESAAPERLQVALRGASGTFEITELDPFVGARTADGRWDAAYAPIRSASQATIPDDLRAAIDANPRARKKFQTLGKMNLFALAFRTNNMKTPAGRAKKIVELVAMLARGETIVPETQRSGPRARHR